MGIFKKLWDKVNQGFFYIVDIDTFRYYMEKEQKFSICEELEAGVDLHLYANGEKHRIQSWNYYACVDEKEREKGYVIYFDEKEYETVDDMIFCELPNLPDYFKIELNLSDDVELNAYKESHPELRVEDF